VEIRKDLLAIEKDSDFKTSRRTFPSYRRYPWQSGSKERSARIESYKASKLEADEERSKEVTEHQIPDKSQSC